MFSTLTHKRASLIAVGTALLLMSACHRDRVDMDTIEERIVLHIDEDRPTATRGSQSAIDIPVEINGSALTLTFEEQARGMAATRSAAVDNTTNPINKIFATALVDSDGRLFFGNEEVAIAENKGTSNIFWPRVPLSFFAYTSSDDDLMLTPTFVREESACKGSFDYVLPAAATAAPRKDATAQPDVLFAITPEQSLENSSEVHLTFHHALSAVLFKVGTMPNGILLKSISLANVYSAGHCEMVATGAEDIQFSWSYSGKSQNATYTEDINQNAVTGAVMGNDTTIFMMLPQNMSNSSVLRLAFTMDGKDYIFEKHINEITPTWEPDKMYIFTIGMPDKIEVEVDDMVEGVVKRDVTIQNTGIVTGYIRAAVVGYWRNNQGQIEKPWRESEQGTYQWPAGWSDNWVKGSDGFYYHLNPVEHGEYTYTLFDSYTLNAAAIASRGTLTLEINIVAQIIPESAVANWPILNELINN